MQYLFGSRPSDVAAHLRRNVRGATSDTGDQDIAETESGAATGARVEVEELTATAVDATQESALIEPLLEQTDPQAEAELESGTGELKEADGFPAAAAEVVEAEAMAVAKSPLHGSAGADGAEEVAATEAEPMVVETQVDQADQEPGADDAVEDVAADEADVAADEVTPSEQLPPATAAAPNSDVAVEAKSELDTTVPVPEPEESALPLASKDDKAVSEDEESTYVGLIQAIRQKAPDAALLIANSSRISRRTVTAAAQANAPDAVAEVIRCLGSDEEKLRMLKVLVGKLLLDPDLPCQQKKRQTPLFFAACTGASGTLSYLLEQNAAVHHEDTEKQTALHYAASLGHVECMRTLIESKADPSKRDVWEQTALFWAAKNGHLECTRELLECTADVEEVGPAAVQGKDGKTPLFYAFDDKIAALLLDRKSLPNVSDTYGQTALFHAAKRGHGALITRLLAKGATVDFKDQWGQTPLFYAVMEGHVKACQELLKANADAHQLNSTGRTPLSIALTPHNYGVERLQPLIQLFEPYRTSRMLQAQSQSPAKSDVQGRNARQGSVVSQGARTRARAGSEVSLGRAAPSQVSSAMHSQVRRQTRQMTASLASPAKRPANGENAVLVQAKRSRYRIAFFNTDQNLCAEDTGAMVQITGLEYEKRLNDLADAVPWLRLHDLQQDLPLP